MQVLIRSGKKHPQTGICMATMLGKSFNTYFPKKMVGFHGDESRGPK